VLDGARRAVGAGAYAAEEERVLRRTVRYNPQDGARRGQLAEFLRTVRKDPRAALRVAAEGVRLDPTSKPALGAAARAAAALNRDLDELRYWRRLSFLTNSDELQDRVARILYVHPELRERYERNALGPPSPA
jgi:hypothetical protein